jgi:YYY domain-containing protein
MISFLAWYVIVSILGLLTFPIFFRTLKNIPDRGYTIARSFGLLLWGYLFWMLASLGILKNQPGGVVLVLVLVGCLGAWRLTVSWTEIKAWAHSNRGILIAGEALFFGLFLLWTIVRAASPDIVGTEKPMELAFINAILQSPSFPPHDPWLSGYAISYYYFGYIMVANLIQVSGASSGAAFNLAISLWFAMTGLNAFGLVYNLLRLTRSRFGQKTLNATAWALLGPLFILVLSNVEGFLEVLHRRGIFWTRGGDGSLQSGFWKWLDIQELVNPPAEPFGWIPQRLNGIWWWRASRVLQDYDLAGRSKEIIDEFPFFSYILADLHPHLLAMPFVLLVITLALNLFSSPNWYARIIPSVQARKTGQAGAGWFNTAVRGTPLGRLDLWLIILGLGGLAFLNTWDFPIYLMLVSLVITYRQIMETGWRWGLIWDFLALVFSMAVCGVVLYFPFYTGFASQAGGFLPSMAFFTRGVHFWVMFAPLLVPVFLWLLLQASRREGEWDWRIGLMVSGAFVLLLFIISYLLGWIGANLSSWGRGLAAWQTGGELAGRVGALWMTLGESFLALQGAGQPGTFLWETLAHRLAMPGTWLTLLGLAWLVMGFLAKQKRNEETGGDGSGVTPNAIPFVLILVLLACLLTLAPEFVYLRDQFGWRMNTIFKFYFQAWILLGCAAAYGFAIVWQERRGSAAWAMKVAMTVVLVMGLAYPIFNLSMRFNNLEAAKLEIDGTAYISRYNPDEAEAIQWLKEAPMGVHAEAIGGSYSGFARFATHSGKPTVLGWPGHESQWRGGGLEMGGREGDIHTLYRTHDWVEAQAIINRYQIRYVVLGALERNAYRISEAKFIAKMKPVFQNGGVTIFEMPGQDERN